MFTIFHTMNHIDNIPFPGEEGYEEYKKESHKAMAKDAIASVVTAGAVLAIGLGLKSMFSSKDEEN